MSDGPLVVAVPSKGRLQDNAAAFFARAGLTLTQARGARDYRGALGGVPDVEVLFLSAAEIVAQLARGGAHLGITGEDLIREEIADADATVELLTPLGFGQANVVVAVPQAWIDVRTMADLDEVAVDLRARHGRKMRVATKYVNLTRRFFAERGRECADPHRRRGGGAHNPRDPGRAAARRGRHGGAGAGFRSQDPGGTRGHAGASPALPSGPCLRSCRCTPRPRRAGRDRAHA
jgi:ATP phosphoribosyltransferase